MITMQNKGQSGTCRVAKMAFNFACWALNLNLPNMFLRGGVVASSIKHMFFPGVFLRSCCW